MATTGSMQLVQLCIDADELRGSVEGQTKLVNMQDRMGQVALHEVVMANRVDACQFLINNGGSTEIATHEPAGRNGPITPRLMANPLTCPEMARMMSVASTKHMRASQKEAETCHYCGGVPQEGAVLKKCAQCMIVRYCSPQCQKLAWRSGHKQQCMQMKSEVKGRVVKLDRPSLDGNWIIPMNWGKMVEKADYRPRVQQAPKHGDGWVLPKGVVTGEEFWLKVQVANEALHPHLCYDKARSTTITVSEGQPAYEQLLQRVKQDGVMGVKAHFKARIDGSGECYVDLGTCAIKQW